jgi:thioredoxin 1
MEITSELLKEKIKNGEKLLIDFHAKWCGPCKLMKPTFEKISEEIKNSGSDVQMYTMDVELNQEFARELGIRSIPTIKGFSNGTEIISEAGLKQEGIILEMVDKFN